LKHYSGICLRRLTETTANLKQDGRSLGRDLKPVPLKYEAGLIQIVVDFQHRIVLSVLQHTKCLDLNPVTFHCRQSS
jgi:hypothetical protein